MDQFTIGARTIGEGQPLYFIADVAANHDGSLIRAYELIEKAKEAGADAAKFQNFIASKIVSAKGFESIPKSSHQANWKQSVYQIYEQASISQEWTALLKEKCQEVGIDYFTSPYDYESVDHVDPYVDMYKIGSGDITWIEIIEYIAKKNKPVMIATGASSLIDVERAMSVLQSYTNKIVLMQCNTNYTASAENFRFINLNVLKTYRTLYPSTILGLSDHTPGHSTVLGAIALGALVFEKHFTDDNTRSGPDHKFAMNPKSWCEMVTAGNEVYLALGDGIKRIEENEKETSLIQRRSLRSTRDLKAGDTIRAQDLFPLRPMAIDGIEPFHIDELIGKKLKADIKDDCTIRWEDIV